MTSYKDCVRYYSNIQCHKKNCMYRHEPAALGVQTLCPKWKDSWCYDMKCKFRHSKTINGHFVSNELCFHESSLKGCTNNECPFRHEKTPDRFFYTGSASLQNSGTSYTELCKHDHQPGGCTWQRCVARHVNPRGLQRLTTSGIPHAPNVCDGAVSREKDINGAHFLE